MSVPDPPFEEWLDYCLTAGHAVFSFEVEDPREERIFSIDNTTIASYMIRLMESSAGLFSRCSDEQLAKAVWFLFGCGSGFFWAVRNSEPPVDGQMRCYRALAAMYARVFDTRCNRHGEEPDADLTNVLPLDTAVYMIWDMDGGVCPYPADDPALEPALSALRTVLLGCRTSTCRISALHALGHLALYVPDRSRPIIEEYLLARPSIPAWERAYAHRARDGAVQ